MIKLFYHQASNQWLIGTRAGRGEHPMMGGQYSYLQAFVDVVTGNVQQYSENHIIQVSTRLSIPKRRN